MGVYCTSLRNLFSAESSRSYRHTSILLIILYYWYEYTFRVYGIFYASIIWYQVHTAAVCIHTTRGEGEDTSFLLNLKHCEFVFLLSWLSLLLFVRFSCYGCCYGWCRCCWLCYIKPLRNDIQHTGSLRPYGFFLREMRVPWAQNIETDNNHRNYMHVVCGASSIVFPC